MSAGRSLLFPDLASSTAKQEQHTQLVGCPLSPCGILALCVADQEDAPFPRKAPEEPGSPHGPCRPARSPRAGEVLGPGAVQGMGRFSREVFRSRHSPPPWASLQLSLKTEKIVLVFLLLLSSYEMSPTMESLNKFWLLKQHLIQLLSNLHHNFKPLIY